MTRPSDHYRSWHRSRGNRLPANSYEPGSPVHVVMRTHARTATFRRHPAARIACDLLAESPATMVACVMPDHVHWLLRDSVDLPGNVGRFKSLCFTRLRGIGVLVRWQRSFWDHVVRHEEGLHATALYILQNPVRHRYVAEARQWPYCVERLQLFE